MSNPYLINATIGEYHLVDFLGQGGMGEVYRGMHAKIGRVAAIKLLTQAARNEPGFVERFFNEARIQANFQHPNIATLYDFLEYQGQPCIIMEYVDGETLCDRVRPYGPLPAAESLRVFAAVVDAVAYIHDHGVIHRDIKSNNIKISSTGQVKLLDFGIAKSNLSPGLTETGSVVGTLEYISPEQLTTGAADARSDIWALGVLLYEMLTGRVPFEAHTLGALCDKIGRVEYTPPQQLNPAAPRAAAELVGRCLRRNPAERFQTARDLLWHVQRAQEKLGAGPSTTASGPRRSGPLTAAGLLGSTREQPGAGSWLARHWLKLAGVAALGLAFLTLAGAGLYYAASSGGPETPAVNGSSLAGNAANTSGPSNASGSSASAQQLRTVTIEMMDGPAQIWRGEEMLGPRGKAQLRARIGERVTLTLKRDGHEPRTVTFEVSTNRSVYSFTMDK